MSVFELWLPILLAGLAVHVASTLAWMVLPHHKPEWQKCGAEDELIDLFESKGVAAGQYLFPFAREPSEMQAEEYKQKVGKCRGTLILWPSPPNMGANIGLTVAHFMAASFVVGYLASLGVDRGARFLEVFQFATTAGVLTHVFCGLPQVIWFRRRVAMEVLDGVAYALITGLVFAALWPAASA